MSKRPSVAMPTAREDKAIIAAAKADPDALPLTAKQLQAMVPMRALRGRQLIGRSSSTAKLVNH